MKDNCRMHISNYISDKMQDIQTKLATTLNQKGIGYHILTHDPVTTMQDVERILKVALYQTAKTLVIKADKKIIIGVIPGNSRLDKKKLAQFLHINRRYLDLATKEEVESLTGLPIGTLPPFGLGYPVVMDRKLLDLDQMYCGFGSFTQSLLICPRDLENAAEATTGDITLTPEV